LWGVPLGEKHITKGGEKPHAKGSCRGQRGWDDVLRMISKRGPGLGGRGSPYKRGGDFTMGTEGKMGDEARDAGGRPEPGGTARRPGCWIWKTGALP